MFFKRQLGEKSFSYCVIYFIVFRYSFSTKYKRGHSYLIPGLPHTKGTQKNAGNFDFF